MAQRPELYITRKLPADFAVDLAPDLNTRTAEVKGRYEQAQINGYSTYQQARAQEKAAEGFLAKGDMANYQSLIKGTPPNPNAQGSGLQGVMAMDDLAEMRRDRARAYKAELDALQAEGNRTNNGTETGRHSQD